jgi:hypothetical protein
MYKKSYFPYKGNEYKRTKIRSTVVICLLWLFSFSPFCAHSQTPNGLGVRILADKKEVLAGELVLFRVQVGGDSLSSPMKLEVSLPLGTRYVGVGSKSGTDLKQLTNLPIPFPSQSDRSTNSYYWNLSPSGSVYWVEFYVRFLPVAASGDGVVKVNVSNPAWSKTISDSTTVSMVRPRNFTSDGFDFEGCVVGMVWLDCNDDKAKSGNELPIPGVQLYLENGTSIVTDRNGLYSMCGLTLKTHVIKVDKTSLPFGVYLDVDNSRNAGNPYSKFLDLKRGELHRADFRGLGCEAPTINRLLSRIEAASSVADPTYQNDENKVFLKGVVFNSDEDRLRVVEPCGKEDQRSFCVEKLLIETKQREAQEKLEKELADREFFALTRERELDDLIHFVIDSTIRAEERAKEEAIRKEQEAFEKLKQKAQDEEKIKAVREKEAGDQKIQDEELQKQIKDELVRRENEIKKQQELREKEITAKQKLLYQEASKDLKLKEVKSTDGDDGISPELIQFDQLLEPAKVLKAE